MSSSNIYDISLQDNTTKFDAFGQCAAGPQQSFIPPGSYGTLAQANHQSQPRHFLLPSWTNISFEPRPQPLSGSGPYQQLPSPPQESIEPALLSLQQPQMPSQGSASSQPELFPQVQPLCHSQSSPQPHSSMAPQSCFQYQSPPLPQSHPRPQTPSYEELLALYSRMRQSHATWLQCAQNLQMALTAQQSENKAMAVELETTRKELQARSALLTSPVQPTVSQQRRTILPVQPQQSQTSQDEVNNLKEQITSLRKTLDAKIINKEARTMCHQLSKAISQGLYSGFKEGDKLISSLERMRKLLSKTDELTQGTSSDDASPPLSNGSHRPTSSSSSATQFDSPAEQTTSYPKDGQHHESTGPEVTPHTIDLTSPTVSDLQTRPASASSAAEPQDREARPNADKIAQFRQGLIAMGKRAVGQEDDSPDGLRGPSKGQRLSNTGKRAADQEDDCLDGMRGLPKRQCTDPFALGSKERDEQRRAAARLTKRREQEARQAQREMEKASRLAERKAQQQAKAARRKEAKEALARKKEYAKLTRARQGTRNQQNDNDDDDDPNDDCHVTDFDDELDRAILMADREEILEGTAPPEKGRGGNEEEEDGSEEEEGNDENASDFDEQMENAIALADREDDLEWERQLERELESDGGGEDDSDGRVSEMDQEEMGSPHGASVRESSSHVLAPQRPPMFDEEESEEE